MSETKQTRLEKYYLVTGTISNTIDFNPRVVKRFYHTSSIDEAVKKAEGEGIVIILPVEERFIKK